MNNLLITYNYVLGTGKLVVHLEEVYEYYGAVARH